MIKKQKQRLKKLFNEYRIKYINISEDAKAYLNTVAKNLLNSNDIKYQRLYDFYLRFICLLSHIRLDAEVAGTAIQIIAQMIEKYSIVTINDAIVGFLNSICKQELFIDSNLCELIRKLAMDSMKIIHKNSSLIDSYHLIVSLATRFSYRGKLFIEDERTVTDILSEKYLNILADIYECCNDRIRQLIKDSFKEWVCQDSITGYYKYANAVSAGIIEADIETEHSAYRFIQKFKKDREQQNKKGIYSGPTIDIEGVYTNLYLLDLLKDKDGFKKIISNNEEGALTWLVNWRDYDYSKFDPTWLLQCSKHLISKMASDKKVKKSILRSFKKYYKKDSTDSQITEIILEHFL